MPQDYEYGNGKTNVSGLFPENVAVRQAQEKARGKFGAKWELVGGVAALAVAGALGLSLGHNSADHRLSETSLMQEVHEHPERFVLVNEDGGIGVNGAANELAVPGTPENKELRQELGAQADSTDGLQSGQYVVEKADVTVPQPTAATMPVTPDFTPMNQR